MSLMRISMILITLLAAAESRLLAKKKLPDNAPDNTPDKGGKQSPDDTPTKGGGGVGPDGTTTTKTLPYHIGGEFYSEDLCFNPYTLCDGWMDTDTFTSPFAGLGQFAMASAELLCDVAGKAFEKSVAVFDAKASLKVTQHGLAGAIFDVKIDTNLEAATLAVTFAATRAEIQVSQTTDALATSDPSKQCKKVEETSQNGKYFRIFKCADAESTSAIFATVDADTFSTSEAKAISTASSGVSTEIKVDGKNVQKVEATLMASASNFAASGSDSLAKAYANAFMEAHTKSFAEICEKKKKQICRLCEQCCFYKKVNEFCDEAYKESGSLAGSFAEAFGSAAASALSHVTVSVLVVAKIERTPGDPDKNNNDISLLLGDDSVANAYIFPTCERREGQ